MTKLIRQRMERGFSLPRVEPRVIITRKPPAKALKLEDPSRKLTPQLRAQAKAEARAGWDLHLLERRSG